MFIGHVPAGYLLTKAWLRRTNEAIRRDRPLLLVGLAASVAPDLDLFWFYFVDRRRHVHHAYWTHLPAFWLAGIGMVAIVLAIVRASRAPWLALAIAGSNILLHLFLDTIAGGVEWLWPLRSTEYVFVRVPARFNPWYLNFLLHWTFGLELLLLLLAIRVWWVQREPGRVRPSLSPHNN